MEGNQHFRQLKIGAAFKEVYINYGFSGLYAGW